MRHLEASFVTGALLVGAALVLPSLADRALLPLGELVGGSDAIVIGTVSRVDEQPRTGVQRATVSVEEILLGAPPPELELAGNRLDPGLPTFYADIRVLLFLTRTDAGFETLAGEHGVITVQPDAHAVTRSMVEEVMQQGTDLQLSSVQYSLRTDSPPLPIVLQGSLLEELSLRVTRQQADLIQAMACSDRNSFRSAAQHWAISQIGMLRLSEARPCLERLTRETEPRDVRILAIEALGNLGDAGALDTLLPLLPEAVAPQAPPVSPPASGENEAVLQRAPADNDGDSQADRLEDPEELPQNASDPEESRLLDQGSPEEIPDPPVVTTPVRLDGDLADAVLLAVGKIGADAAIESLRNVALNSPDPALSSTAVHALGLIGTPAAYDTLVVVSETKDDALIRDQANRTVQRLRPKR